MVKECRNLTESALAAISLWAHRDSLAQTDSFSPPSVTFFLHMPRAFKRRMLDTLIKLEKQRLHFTSSSVALFAFPTPPATTLPHLSLPHLTPTPEVIHLQKSENKEITLKTISHARLTKKYMIIIIIMQEIHSLATVVPKIGSVLTLILTCGSK